MHACNLPLTFPPPLLCRRRQQCFHLRCQKGLYRRCRGGTRCRKIKIYFLTAAGVAVAAGVAAAGVAVAAAGVAVAAAGVAVTAVGVAVAAAGVAVAAAGVAVAAAGVAVAAACLAVVAEPFGVNSLSLLASKTVDYALLLLFALVLLGNATFWRFFSCALSASQQIIKNQINFKIR